MKQLKLTMDIPNSDIAKAIVNQLSEQLAKSGIHVVEALVVENLVQSKVSSDSKPPTSDTKTHASGSGNVTSTNVNQSGDQNNNSTTKTETKASSNQQNTPSTTQTTISQQFQSVFGSEEQVLGAGKQEVGERFARDFKPSELFDAQPNGRTVFNAIYNQIISVLNDPQMSIHYVAMTTRCYWMEKVMIENNVMKTFSETLIKKVLHDKVME